LIFDEVMRDQSFLRNVKGYFNLVGHFAQKASSIRANFHINMMGKCSSCLTQK